MDCKSCVGTITFLGRLQKLTTFLSRFGAYNVGSTGGEHLLKEIRIIITRFNIYNSHLKNFTSKINEGEGLRDKKNGFLCLRCEVMWGGKALLSIT